jgi:hypothetical protein
MVFLLVKTCHDRLKNLVREFRRDVSQREIVLCDLQAAYETYLELGRNIQEGLKFFGDMDELLNTSRQKCQEFVNARRMELNQVLS